MQLSKKQRKLVKKLGDPLFTVEFIEEFYKESLDSLPSKYFMNESFTNFRICKVDAFMRAVDCMLDVKAK